MRSKFCLILATLILTLAGCAREQMIPNENFTYARSVSAEEQAIRDAFVAAAIAKAGVNEADGSHKAIIDAYNAHEPLAQGYPVKYDDEWCATFVSAAAIEAGMTQIIPTECGCQRQIDLFRVLGTWEEADDYLPLPGDIIAEVVKVAFLSSRTRDKFISFFVLHNSKISCSFNLKNGLFNTQHKL